MAGIWYSNTASTNKPMLISKIFLLVMQKSLPELDESVLISKYHRFFNLRNLSNFRMMFMALLLLMEFSFLTTKETKGHEG